MPDFVIQDWTLDPVPGDQAPLHVHHRGDEAFIVISGSLSVEDSGSKYILGPGEVHLVNAGSPHTFATLGEDPVRVLCVMTQEIADLIEALHDPGQPDKDNVWNEHHSALAN